jgi:diaminopimelate decarboxylase
MSVSAPLSICAPPLTAKLAPWMVRLIKNPELVCRLTHDFGSPVHLVVTSEFGRNVQDLLSPLHDRGVAAELYFARKANKSSRFVIAVKEANIGIDTASLQELQEALELGVNPQQIVVTAIGKEEDILLPAIARGCLLVIDNFDELSLTQAVAQSLGKPARIGLRFSGFEFNGQRFFSRFGFPVSDWGALMSKLEASPLLRLELLHAHLDRYDVNERVCAACQLIELADAARTCGHEVKALDLGGGILVRYLQSENEWQTFSRELLAAVSGIRPPFTYLSDGFGYHKMGNEIFGKSDFYPAWNNLSKERFVSAILDDCRLGLPLHKEISGRGLTLCFEPGRALLDNAGVTLARVTFRKRDIDGNLLIGVAMNRTNLHPFRAEFCSDPILISMDKREKATEGAFIVGNLCMESDVILRRKLAIDNLPQPGDIFCFANTAGYFAHLLETATHGNPLPNNILVDPISCEVLEAM